MKDSGNFLLSWQLYSLSEIPCKVVFLRLLIHPIETPSSNLSTQVRLLGRLDSDPRSLSASFAQLMQRIPTRALQNLHSIIFNANICLNAITRMLSTRV